MELTKAQKDLIDDAQDMLHKAKDILNKVGKQVGVDAENQDADWCDSDEGQEVNEWLDAISDQAEELAELADTLADRFGEIGPDSDSRY